MVDQTGNRSPGHSPQDLDDGLGGPSDPDAPISSAFLPQTQEDIDDQARNWAQANLAQRVILPEGATKGDAIYTLSRQVPKNEYGLPMMFYRSDMLPFNLGLLTTDDADAAMVELNYDDGYPTFMQNRIFWQQMPHEQWQDFLTFQRYLDQAEETGIRQLQLLAMSEKLALEKVSELAKEYYWRDRARAFDLFQVAATKKQRDTRARKIETSDYQATSNLIQVLLQKFEDPEWIEKLSPQEALNALGDLMKLRRISLGLAANGNAGAAADSPNAGLTTEVIMRQLTKNIGFEDSSLALTDDVQQLLLDPQFTMRAQELIFRVRKGVPTAEEQSQLPMFHDPQ